MLNRLVLKENEIFAVTDRDGNIRADAMDGEGLYFQDTRFLSIFEFSIDHLPLQLLSSAGELNFMSNFQFGNQPSTLDDGSDVPGRVISVRRNRFIDAGLHERIGLMNYGPTTVELTIRLTVGSDFRDMFDVRGYMQRPRRGMVSAPAHEGDTILLRYLGLDDVTRRTEITFDRVPDDVVILHPEPTEVGILPTDPAEIATMDVRTEVRLEPPSAQALFHAKLEPGKSWSMTVNVEPVVEAHAPPRRPFPALDDAFVRIADEYRQWMASCTRITTDHDLINNLIDRNVQDLRLTINKVDSGLLPVAGIPWFSVPFGRDSLIASLQTLSLNPDIAYGTLRFLALHQGTRVDPWCDEEPGKILHEIRSGEMAALHEVPQTPYYGSVDSTPLFVVVFTELMRWMDDMALAAELRPHLERALQWIRTYGDPDGDGLLEYESKSTRGIHNQGWKDSHDSVTFPDGSYAQAPIAIAEVQGYAYAAERGMAEMYARWGEPERTQECLARAARLKRRFDEAFWLESLGFYAEALDAHKAPVPALTSNPGHCLLMGMLDGPRADRFVARLMQDDMMCGWGLRTLSGDFPTFNPMSYHNGSVWPHDNSIVVAGLRRAGYADEAVRVIQEMFDAGIRLPSFRMPELFCGFSRDRRYQSLPASYPVSCSPQAWAAGSVFLMLQHLVGLEVDLPHHGIRLSPALLPSMNEIHFEHLRLGGGRTISVDVYRLGDEVACKVHDAEGLQVEIRPIRPQLVRAR
jgi:glycogen debranching enzyme